MIGPPFCWVQGFACDGESALEMGIVSSITLKPKHAGWRRNEIKEGQCYSDVIPDVSLGDIA